MKMKLFNKLFNPFTAPTIAKMLIWFLLGLIPAIIYSNFDSCPDLMIYIAFGFLSYPIILVLIMIIYAWVINPLTKSRKKR